MDVAIVSVPLAEAKKKQDLSITLVSRFNFGALSLASYLYSKGVSAKVFDPQHVQKDKQLEATIAWLKKNSPRVIGLSCISGFSYDNLKLFTEKIIAHIPNAKVIVGGKDQVGMIPEAVLQECEGLDAVFVGESEVSLLKYVSEDSEGIRIYKQGLDVDVIPRLNYNLYESFGHYPPSIEVSRGCVFGCAFCSNNKDRKYIRKDAQDVISEAKEIVTIYNNDAISIYFQAPLFVPSIKYLSELAEQRKKEGLIFRWRAQCRADSIDEDVAIAMAKAGAAVIDLGLESGSERMLYMMKKTDDPKLYLAQSRRSIELLRHVGIVPKLNILFYVGETWDTIKETFTYLRSFGPNELSVSAYPVIGYPGTTFINDVKNDLAKAGGTVVEDSLWAGRHLTPINPSRDFTYEYLKSLGCRFGKAFQTQLSYYNERSVGYYKPTSSFDDFINATDRLDHEWLPYSKSREEMILNSAQLSAMIESNLKGIT